MKIRGIVQKYTINVDGLQVEVKAGQLPIRRHFGPLTNDTIEFLNTNRFDGIETLGRMEIEFEVKEATGPVNWQREGF